MDFISLLEKIQLKHSPPISENILDELIHFMLQNIGSTNSKLRDELIYTSFCELISNYPLSNEQLSFILKTCLDSQHLLYHIDRFKDEDAVFTRSFSTLVIVLCLMKDHEEPYIPEDLLNHTMKTCKLYFINEVDFRGYINYKGWAHSVAHSSDLLAQLTMHPRFDHYISLTECLNVLRRWIATPTPLIDNEHERIVQVVASLINKGLSQIELSDWLNSLQSISLPDYYPSYRVQWNVEKFLHALYFKFVSMPEFYSYSSMILNHFILKNKIEV